AEDQAKYPAAPPAGSSKGAQHVYYDGQTGVVYAVMGKNVVAHRAGGGQLQCYEGHAGPVTCVLLAQGWLFSGSVDATVMCWNLQSHQVSTILKGHTAAVWALAASPAQLFSGSQDGTIRQWSLQSFQEVRVLKGHSGPVPLLLMLDSGLLCSGSLDATVRLWHDGTVRHTLSGHEDGISCILSTQQGLLVGSRDCRITLWQGCKLRATLVGHEDWVMCLLEAFGSWWSGSRDQSIKRWDPWSRELLASFEGHQSGVSCLIAFSGSLLSGSGDRSVKQWHPGDAEGLAIASIRGDSGVSSLLELPSGIFRTAARGEAVLLAKPRPLPPEVKVETLDTCLRSPRSAGELSPDDRVVDVDINGAEKGFDAALEDLVMLSDYIPSERDEAGATIPASQVIQVKVD
ncbi:unnamed protein product, partial [Effrenium voratum]